MELRAGLLPSACSHRAARANNRALKSEFSLSPSIPLGGRAVDTNV